MKTFFSAVGVCCLLVGGVLWATEIKNVPRIPWSIVGTWKASVGDVNHEFVVDETHISLMGQKMKYTVAHEGKWALIEVTEDKAKFCLLLEFVNKDKMKLLCFGPKSEKEMFFARK